MKELMDFNNTLLKRREVKIVVEAPSNPGFTNAQKMIADKYNAKEDEIVVKAVKSKFGRNTFLIDAFIYNSAQDKVNIEPKKKVKKKAEGSQ
jgi:ribosomal protein S24E